MSEFYYIHTKADEAAEQASEYAWDRKPEAPAQNSVHILAPLACQVIELARQAEAQQAQVPIIPEAV